MAIDLLENVKKDLRQSANEINMVCEQIVQVGSEILSIKAYPRGGYKIKRNYMPLNAYSQESEKEFAELLGN